MKTLRLAIVIIALALNTAPGDALATSLRCGTRLISEGDTSHRVLKECGQPTNIEEWEEERYHYYDSPPRYSDRYDRGFDRYYDNYGPAYRVKIHVRIEEWIYNHGPHRFMDLIRFENGKVRKIFSGDYGY